MDIPGLRIYPEVLTQVDGQTGGRRGSAAIGRLSGLDVEIIGIRPMQLLPDIKPATSEGVAPLQRIVTVRSPACQRRGMHRSQR